MTYYWGWGAPAGDPKSMRIITGDDVEAAEDWISGRYGLEKYSLPMNFMAPWIALCALCDELPNRETFQRMLDYTRRDYLWRTWLQMVDSRLELEHVEKFVVAFYVAANGAFILDEVREYICQNLCRFPRYQRLELEKSEKPKPPRRSEDDEIRFKLKYFALVGRLPSPPPPPGPIYEELYILLRRWYQKRDHPRLVEIPDRREHIGIPTDYFLELFENYQRRPEPLDDVPPYPGQAKLRGWEVMARHPTVIWAVDEWAPSFPIQTGPDMFPVSFTEEWNAFRRKDGE